MALVHLSAGRLAAARETIEAVPAQDWGTSTEVNGNRLLLLAEVAAHTGDRTLMHEVAVEARNARDSESPLVTGGAAFVLALEAWQRGDADKAAGWLRGYAFVFTLMWSNLLDQLDRDGAGGRPTRATTPCAHASKPSPNCSNADDPQVPLLSVLAAYTRGLLADDAQALVAAADSLRAFSMPLMTAGAAEDAGAALGRLDRTDDAIAHLNHAFDLYVECEAVADAYRVAKALRAYGVTRRVTQRRAKTGWDSLTDSELKVVYLIADGATNHAVAQQLHLSPHTVHTHVRNAFAKLGISSRIELRRKARPE